MKVYLLSGHNAALMADSGERDQREAVLYSTSAYLTLEDAMAQATTDMMAAFVDAETGEVDPQILREWDIPSADAIEQLVWTHDPKAGEWRSTDPYGEDEDLLIREVEVYTRSHLRKVAWSFDTGEAVEPGYVGYTDGTKWNGFDNIWIEPDVRDQVAADAAKWPGDDGDTAVEIRALPIDERTGLVSLANGYTCLIWKEVEQ